MSDFGSPEFERELTQAKLRALAEFAAGAGHEINNPVATIAGYAQQLLAKETDPDRRQALLTIGGQAYRIRDMIGDLMYFARPPQPRPESLDLAAVCQEVIARLATDAEAASCTLSLDSTGPVPIWADPVQLRSVVAALCRNSIEATTLPQAIVVRTTVEEISNRPWAMLEVRDHGRGFSDLEREHAFDPFFSGRQAGRGLGFGLCKAWRIVTQHGGTIGIESPVDGGAVVRVRWPGAAKAESGKRKAGE